MGNLKLKEINEQAIKQWEKSIPRENIRTTKRFKGDKKEKHFEPRSQRPPQVREKRPRGKSLTEIVFSKKKGRYIEQEKEQPSSVWGFAQGVNEEHEITEEKLKSIQAMDRIQAGMKRDRYHGVNTTCLCGCRDEKLTPKDLGLE